jgi:DNA-3-methyladenine glycosylase
MYGPPGTAYVYFIYGNHFCVNVVCQPEGVGEAVLIRALEPGLGLALLHKQRPVRREQDLTNGPGKLCAALQIGRSLDGVDLCDLASPLFIAANPERGTFLAARGPLVKTERVGITKAAHLLLRFCLGGSSFISQKTPALRSRRGDLRS